MIMVAAIIYANETDIVPLLTGKIIILTSQFHKLNKEILLRSNISRNFHIYLFKLLR